MMTIGKKSTDEMSNALKKNDLYKDAVVVKAGAISVSADGTKHLDIVKFLGTQAGRNRLASIMDQTKLPQEE
jgi:hypothetical protein